jgi:outer membrane lipopolysaccharide assembly protein LptE/RlpB
MMENSDTLNTKLEKSSLNLPFEWNEKLKSFFGIDLSKQTITCNPCIKSIKLQNNVYQKEILSLNSAGRVREYRLKYFVEYTYQHQQISEKKKLSLYRDMTFNDATILAKQQEEELLKKDMEREILEVLLSHL